MNEKKQSKFNLIQKFGVAIILLGLLCVLFPSVVGITAIKIASLFIMILGLLGALLAVSYKNIVDLFLHFLIMIFGMLSFTYFYDIFLYLGLTCIVYSILELLVIYRKETQSLAKVVITAIFLFVLGLLMILFDFDQNIVTLGALIMIGGLLLLNETRHIDLKQITNTSAIFHFDAYDEKQKSKDYTSFSTNDFDKLEHTDKQFTKDLDAVEVDFEEIDAEFEEINFEFEENENTKRY